MITDEIKELLKDYKRRLKTIIAEVAKGGNDLTLNRLGTKASCYRTFISELERALEKVRIENKMIPPNDGSKCVCEYYPAECSWCHTQLAEDSC